MKNKYLSIISIGILILIVGYFIYKKPKINVSENILDSQIEIKKNSIDTNFYVVPNDNLILVKEINLPTKDKDFINKRIEENQLKVDAFNEETSLMDRINMYFIISADYRLLGEYGKSKELLEKILILDSKNSNVMQAYSSLLSVMGDKISALIYINKAIALYSVESNYWLWKIDLEKDRNISNDKIELIYKNALESTNNDLNIIVSYASFLALVDKKEDAIIQWQEAIKKYPQNKDIYQKEIELLK